MCCHGEDPVPRLLIVDDEKDLLEMLFDHFRELGYVVDTSPSGVGALAIIREVPPDVVLLDLNLRGSLSGLDVLRAMRRGWPGIPVIMVTGNADVAVGRDILAEGAFDYVAKPFALAHLAEVVAIAVGGAPGADAP